MPRHPFAIGFGGARFSRLPSAHEARDHAGRDDRDAGERRGVRSFAEQQRRFERGKQRHQRGEGCADRRPQRDDGAAEAVERQHRHQHALVDRLRGDGRDGRVQHGAAAHGEIKRAVEQRGTDRHDGRRMQRTGGRVFRRHVIDGPQQAAEHEQREGERPDRAAQRVGGGQRHPGQDRDDAGDPCGGQRLARDPPAEDGRERDHAAGRQREVADRRAAQRRRDREDVRRAGAGHHQHDRRGAQRADAATQHDRQQQRARYGEADERDVERVERGMRDAQPRDDRKAAPDERREQSIADSGEPFVVLHVRSLRGGGSMCGKDAALPVMRPIYYSGEIKSENVLMVGRNDNPSGPRCDAPATSPVARYRPRRRCASRAAVKAGRRRRGSDIFVLQHSTGTPTEWPPR